MRDAILMVAGPETNQHHLMCLLRLSGRILKDIWIILETDGSHLEYGGTPEWLPFSLVWSGDQSCFTELPTYYC